MARQAEHTALEDGKETDRAGADDRNVATLNRCHIGVENGRAADGAQCRIALFPPSPKRHKTKGMTQRVIDLADEAATARLAARVAGTARARDTIALAGPLGSGKTSFARAFIRALGNGDEDVPSPTFTLVETYRFAGRPPIWHFDLYRLEAPDDVYELGIEEAWAEGISLIEWPDRIARLLPAGRLDVTLATGGTPERRRAMVSGGTHWQELFHE